MGLFVVIVVSSLTRKTSSSYYLVVLLTRVTNKLFSIKIAHNDDDSFS